MRELALIVEVPIFLSKLASHQTQTVHALAGQLWRILLLMTIRTNYSVKTKVDIKEEINNNKREMVYLQTPLFI